MKNDERENAAVSPAEKTKVIWNKRNINSFSHTITDWLQQAAMPS